MKLNMTIDECLEFADEWSRGMTLHEGSQGWRVVCMLLAEEVRRLRADETRLSWIERCCILEVYDDSEGMARWDLGIRSPYGTDPDDTELRAAIDTARLAQAAKHAPLNA
jgi:hypothetical protein